MTQIGSFIWVKSAASICRVNICKNGPAHRTTHNSSLSNFRHNTLAQICKNKPFIQHSFMGLFHCVLKCRWPAFTSLFLLFLMLWLIALSSNKMLPDPEGSHLVPRGTCSGTLFPAPRPALCLRASALRPTSAPAAETDPPYVCL